MANKILNLAILAGLGYAGYNALSSSDKQAATKALGFKSVPQNEADYVELIKSTIKADKELQRMLTGPTGANGATGETGATGENGATGDTVQNYGGSLIKNGAIELGTLEGWTGAVMGEGSNLLVASLKSTGTAYCENSFIPVLDRLYSIEYYVKNEGTVTQGGGVCIDGRLTNGVLADVSKRIYPVGGWVSSNYANFTKRKLYFGGYGSESHNIKDGVSKISPTVFKNQGISISINALIVKVVELGEVVPHNLPFLPLNQTVLNNTTGKVGIFNGTTVDYYF